MERQISLVPPRSNAQNSSQPASERATFRSSAELLTLLRHFGCWDGLRSRPLAVLGHAILRW
jgi:hypothetical protein